MSFADAKTYLDLADPVVNQNGYLGNVPVIPAGPHDLMGSEYLTHACATGETWTDLCYNANLTPCDESPVTPPAGGFKTFAQPELVEGSPFAVYDGVECDGLTIGADDLAGAETRLAYSEGRQVDYNVRAVLETLVTANLGTLPIATTIALFEEYTSALYGSYGVISLPRGLVVHARSQDLIFDAPGGGLQTVTGTTVVPTAQEVPGDPTIAYLSGRITLIQGTVQSRVAPAVTRPDGSCDPQRALAERMYVPLIECTVVKATATSI